MHTKSITGYGLPHAMLRQSGRGVGQEQFVFRCQLVYEPFQILQLEVNVPSLNSQGS